MKRRKQLLALLAAGVAAAAVLTAVPLGTQRSSGAAPARSAQSLDVVGGPVAVGSTAVVISVDKTHLLHLDGIDPVNESVLWQRPYSASAVTPGVALAPAAVGNTLIDVVPFSKPGNPAVRIVGINATTGATTWQNSTGVVLSDNPASCASEQDFCLTGYNPDGSTSLILIDAVSGEPKSVINGPNRALGLNLYQSDSSTPTFQQLSPSGTIAWTKSVAAIFGPGYDPSSGWNITPVGNLNVGSVSPAAAGRTVDFGANKTLGFDVATGTAQWTLAGAYQCMGPLIFLSSQVTCQYSGKVHYAKGATVLPRLGGVTLKLVGFDPTSGSVTWTLPVSNVASLTFGNGVRFLDGTHLVVRETSGKVVLLDTATGAPAPLKSGQTLWCEKTPIYSVVSTKGAPQGGKRVSEPVYYPCAVNGTRKTQPPSFPSSVGATVNGVFIWPSPTGLNTHVVGEPSSTA
jgi:hypothetical protein